MQGLEKELYRYILSDLRLIFVGMCANVSIVV